MKIQCLENSIELQNNILTYIDDKNMKLVADISEISHIHFKEDSILFNGYICFRHNETIHYFIFDNKEKNKSKELFDQINNKN